MKQEYKARLRDMLRDLVEIQDEITHLNEQGVGLAAETTIKVSVRNSQRDKIINFVETLVDATQQVRAADGAKLCPECDSEIAVCMMGHYCGEVTPRR